MGVLYNVFINDYGTVKVRYGDLKGVWVESFVWVYVMGIWYGIRV